jgi:hypothetical protein
VAAGDANKQPSVKNKSLNGTESKPVKGTGIKSATGTGSKSSTGTGIKSATGPETTKKPVKKNAPVKMLQKMDITGKKESHLRTRSFNDNKEIKTTIKIEHFIII